MSVHDGGARHKSALTAPGGRGLVTDHLVGIWERCALLAAPATTLLEPRRPTMTATTSATNRRLGSTPDPSLLDDAERLGVDELRALQLERLQWTLRHAYENVPHYRRAL